MEGMQTHPPPYPTDLTAEAGNQIESLVPAPTSEKGSVVDRSPGTGAVCLTQFPRTSARAGPGVSCPGTWVRGRASRAPSGWGAKTGPGSSCPMSCGTVGAKPQVARGPHGGQRGQPIGEDSGSGRSTRRRCGQAALGAQSAPAAMDCLGLRLAVLMTPAAGHARAAARPLIQARGSR